MKLTKKQIMFYYTDVKKVGKINLGCIHDKDYFINNIDHFNYFFIHTDYKKLIGTRYHIEQNEFRKYIIERKEIERYFKLKEILE